MYTFNTPLKTAIDGQTTQKAVNDKLNEMLGSTRTLSLIKDGTTIYSATMQGAIRMERNSIVDYGYVVSESVNAGGNLLTGTTKLRISGGGNYMEADAGLTVAAQQAAGIGSPVIRDFMLSANPTPGSGIGFSTKIKTTLPVKPNGIGPAAPTIVPRNAPAKFEIYSVVNGTEAFVGSLTFDTPDDPILFADPEIAGQMGETMVTKSSQSIIFDKFEFGAKRYISSASNSIDGSTPLIRVLTASKPYNQGWDSYPAEKDFNPSTVYMHPPAFRAKLRDYDNNIIYTWQGHDGTPINDPSWQQGWWSGSTQPCRPFWHCAMSLPWQNVRARISDLKNKFYSGVEADYLRPTMGKGVTTSNGTEPFVDGYTSLNGYNHFWQSNKWPQPGYDEYQARASEDQPTDPYAQPIGTDGNHGTYQLINGWGWEPGSKSGQEYQTGPGGMRYDRQVIPNIYAIFATDPNFVRPKGNVPIRDMVDAHANAFFNMPMFLYRDVKNFTGIPDDEICAINTLWNHRDAYYGGTGGKGPDRTVPMRGVTQGNSTSSGALSRNRDVHGNLYWNGFLPDYLHAYQNPGWLVLMLNDPIYAVALKQRYNTTVMAQLDEQTDAHNDFMYWGNRQYAWRLSIRTMAWKCASGKEAGHERAVLEEIMRVGLESIYNFLYVPCYESKNLGPYHTIVKNLGVQNYESVNTRKYDGGGLAFYLADVLVLMKQTGFWSVMRKKNYKCEKALFFLLTALDRASIDWILDTDGNGESIWGSGYYEVAMSKDGSAPKIEDTPTSWADWMVKTYPMLPTWNYGDPGDWIDTQRWDKRPGVSWLRQGDGGGFVERHAAQHQRMGWVLNRMTYFPEYPEPRAQAAHDKLKGYHDERRNFVNGLVGTDKRAAANADWTYLLASNGKRLPPSELGAV